MWGTLAQITAALAIGLPVGFNWKEITNLSELNIKLERATQRFAELASSAYSSASLKLLPSSQTCANYTSSGLPTIQMIEMYPSKGLTVLYASMDLLAARDLKLLEGMRCSQVFVSGNATDPIVACVSSMTGPCDSVRYTVDSNNFKSTWLHWSAIAMSSIGLLVGGLTLLTRSRISRRQRDDHQENDWVPVPTLKA